MKKSFVILIVALLIFCCQCFSVYASNKSHGVTINVILLGGEAPEKFYDKAIPMFEASTGIKVKYTCLTFEKMTEKALMLSAAKSSTIDVYSTHFAQIGKFIPHFEPLENYMSAADYMDFIEAGIKPLTFDGHIIALPRYFDARLLYYRTDLFKKAGIAAPPKTWESLVSTAQKLTQDFDGDGVPDQYGLVVVGKGDPALRQFSDFLWQAGGDFLDENYNPTFNGPEGIKALKFYRDLIYKYKVVPKGVPGFRWAEVTQLFKGGTVAMNYDWPGVIGLYDAEDSLIRGKYSFASMPGDKTTMSTAVCHAYAINKYSKKKEAAWEFMKWMTSSQMMVLEHELTGTLPTRKSALNEVISQAKGREKDRLIALQAVFANGNSWPKIPEWGEICPIIWNEIEAVLIQTKSVEDALNKATESVKRILEKAGYYR